MARRKAPLISQDPPPDYDTSPPSDLPPPPSAFPDEDGDNLDPVGELMQILHDAQEPHVVVYRFPRNGPRELVDRFLVAEFDPFELRRRYGPGRYQVRLQGDQGRLGRSKLITLAAPGQSGSSVDGAVVTAPAGSASETAELRALVRELVLVNARPQSGGLQGMQEMMLAMSTAAAQQATTLIGLFKEMAGDRSPPPPPAPTQSLGEMFEAFESFMNLKERFTTDTEPREPSVLAFLAPLLPSLTQALENYNMARGNNPPTPPARPALPAAGDAAPSEAAAGAAAPPREPQAPPSPFVMLKPFIGQAVMLARTGAKPYTWGRTVAVQGGKVVDVLVELYDAEGPEAFYRELLDTFPELREHEGWVREFVESIVQEDEEEGDERDGDGADRDPAE